MVARRRPTLSDNATINAGGTYTVSLAGVQAANNVTLNSANATVNVAFNQTSFNLGGTLLLSAGTWVTGGLNDTPATFTGGTVTRGATGTGRFSVAGVVRFQNTQVQG